MKQFTVTSHTDYWPELNQAEAFKAAERLAEKTQEYAGSEVEVKVGLHRPSWEETDETWYQDLVRFCNETYAGCYSQVN